MNKNRKIFLPIFLLTGLALVFFWKFFLKSLIPIPADIIVGIYYPWRDHIWSGLVAGVPFKNGLLSDVVSIIYPWRIYGMKLIKNGVPPLWIPHALAGSPLLANFQSAVLYPFNFLFFIFSEVNAWSIYIMLQPILASFFCYLYLKNLKLNFLSSLIGAFVFAFSGFMLVWLEYGIVGHAGLWLPLLLLTVDKLFEEKSFKWMVIGSLGIAFSILAGYPQVVAYSLLASTFYAVYKIFFLREKEVASTAGLLILALIFGLLLSAVQLLPGIELWQLSIRQSDPAVASFNYGIIPFKNLVLLLAPDFFGNPSTLNFWGWGGYNESAGYIGVIALVLAVIGLFYAKEKILKFFKIFLLLAFLFAYETPLAALPYKLNLPGLSRAMAGRMLFLLDFSLAVLSAFGVSFLLKKKKAKETNLIILLFGLIFGLLWGVVFLAPKLWPGASWLVNLAVSKRNLVLSTALYLAGSVLLVMRNTEFFSKKVTVIIGLLFSLIVFDSFRFGWKYNSFSKREYLYPETNLTKFLQEKIGIDRFVGLITSSLFIPYNLSSPEGYEPLMIKRYSEFVNQVNEEKVRAPNPGSRWATIHRLDSPLLSLLGVRYKLYFNPLIKTDWEPADYKFPKEKNKLIFQYGWSQIYENLESLPRVFIAHDYQVVKNGKEIFEALLSEDFNPRQTLILEEEPSIKPTAGDIDEERVVIDKNRYFFNRVSMKTNSTSDGLLFLSDSFYPGWKAFVDGKQTKIYRANYSFRAIALPAGDHQISFIYDPLSFKIGLCLSLGTILLLTITGAWIHKYRKEWW